MKINKVQFKNFKSYVNETEFDFSDKNHINILLGENGNGKTSFLEGVSLAFFGRKMFNSDASTKEYTEFVASRLSNTATSNTITLIVEYIDEDEVYILKRTYVVSADGVESESFDLTKEDHLVDQSPFLQRYNYEIMEKFFIDGERINELISNDKIDDFIKGFVDIAFNIAVFKQIDSDIDRIEKEQIKTQQTKEHKMVEKDVETLEGRVNFVKQQLLSKQQILPSIELHEKTVREKMIKKEIAFGDHLQKLVEDSDKLNAEVNELSFKVREFMLDDLQWLLHKDVLSKLVRKLNRTRENRMERVIELYSQLGGKTSLDIPEDYIPLELEKKLIEKSCYKTSEKKSEIEELLKRLTDKKKNQTRNKTKLSKSKEGQEQLDDVAEHQELLLNLQKTKADIESLEEELETLQIKLDVKQALLDRYNEDILSRQLADNFTIEKAKLKKVVARYVARKTVDIYREIGIRSVELLSKYILRKGSLIDDISFNNGTLQVSREGQRVNYSNFSAGEKQMLIVGILFAIVDLADLDIPLVLDSFIGRLDKKHTNNILKYLKDRIDNQIIVLSTDSEVDEDVIKELRMKLGNSYVLDNDGFSTTIKEVEYEG